MAKKDTYQLNLTIKRYSPEKGGWESRYTLRASAIKRFVDVFRQVNEEHDPTFAWRSSCEHAQCGSCTVMMNGEPVLSCKILVGDAVEHFKTTSFRIEPIPLAPVLRDLVVDFRSLEKKIQENRPWLIRPAEPPAEGDEYRIPPDVVEEYAEATRCIYCFTCASGCPTQNDDWIGPNLTMLAWVRFLDPRETAKEERLRYIFDERGIMRCRTGRVCTVKCPKEIHVAEYIADAKSHTD